MLNAGGLSFFYLMIHGDHEVQYVENGPILEGHLLRRNLSFLGTRKFGATEWGNSKLEILVCPFVNQSQKDGAKPQ